VSANIGKNAIGVVNSQTTAPFSFDDYNAVLVVLVVHSWLVHLGIWDGILKTQEVVSREYKVVSVLVTGMHHSSEHLGHILSAKVDNIAHKAS